MKYPDLTKEKIIAFDIETYDPNLKEMGPGVFRKDGKVLGISIATPNDFAEYYNLAHYDCTNDIRAKNLKYLKEVLEVNSKKVGTNIIYDIDWIENTLDIKVNGQLYDITIAEALIDENQGFYNLDFQAEKYLNSHKIKNELDTFCESNALKGDVRKWIYKMPYKLIKKYAIGDVELPLKILKIQWKILSDQNLLDLFHMECDLLRVLLLMRKTGVKIDVDKRNKNTLQTQNIIKNIHGTLYEKYGKFNYNSGKQIAKLLDLEGVEYSLTDKGNPHIDEAYLKMHLDNKLINNIHDIRKADKMLNSFLLGSCVKFLTSNDLIHCSFYNTRNDLYGTRSGRLSSANPNLQQIPSPGVSTFWGTICREPFVPFDNCLWAKIDYSQIEYRFMAHFAVGPGSEEVRQTYNDNPETDYHQYIMDLTKLKRRFAKNLNFGVAYGMGAKHMAEFFNWTLTYAYEILNIYHSKAPFIKSTIKLVEKVAIRRGYIKTILKRRSRLLDKKKAYIMFCRLIQGSAADLLKKAMLDVYDAGILDVLKLHLTVHDELDF